METNNHLLPTASIGLGRELSDLALPFEAVSPDALLARSKRNVSRWKLYLSGECITTMIEMGWDITT
jgi:hypothetical protein